MSVFEINVWIRTRKPHKRTLFRQCKLLKRQQIWSTGWTGLHVFVISNQIRNNQIWQDKNQIEKLKQILSNFKLQAALQKQFLEFSPYTIVQVLSSEPWCCCFLSDASNDYAAILYTVFSPISGHRWCKKYCPLIGGASLLESFSISVLTSRIKHFSISIRCSWVD